MLAPTSASSTAPSTAASTTGPDELPSEASSVASLPSSISVTRRRDRSSRTRFLHATLKAVRPRLVKPSTAPRAPGVSPELRAPEAVFELCNVRQRQVGEIRVYDINVRSRQTGEAFIPAQVHDLRHELTPVRTNDSSHHALSQIQSHEANDVTARDFAKAAPVRGRPKHVYWFCGGGFQSPPSENHWRFAAALVARLNEATGGKSTVSIVSVPLAPEHRLAAAFGHLEAFYHEILPSTPPGTPAPEPSIPLASPLANGTASTSSLPRLRTRYLKPEDDIVFAGDSSGGNLALALTLHMLSKNPHVRVPTALMLVCPAVDLTNENPDMREVTKRDPVMTLDFVRSVAKAWCGDDVRMDDPRASPLHADVADLAFRKVRVNGVVAGDDVLAPDALRLIEKLKRSSVQGRWLVWDRMMHCFPLAQHYKLPESVEGMKWIVENLVR